MNHLDITIFDESRGKDFLVITGAVSISDGTAFQAAVSASSPHCSEIWVLQQHEIHRDLKLASVLKPQMVPFTIVLFGVGEPQTLIEYEIVVDGETTGPLYARASTLFMPTGSFDIQGGDKVEGWIFDPALFEGEEHSFLSYGNERLELKVSDGSLNVNSLIDLPLSLTDGVFRFTVQLPKLQEATAGKASIASVVVLTSSGHVLHCKIIEDESEATVNPSIPARGGITHLESSEAKDVVVLGSQDLVEAPGTSVSGAAAPTASHEFLIAPEIISALQDPLIFDVVFYRESYSLAGSESSVVADYLSNLMRQGSPYFDPAWYLTSIPSAGPADWHPLHHYLTVGRKENLRPSAIFDGTKIDMSREMIAELVEGSGLFDPIWYLHAYKDVERSKSDPMQHYIAVGHREYRRWPNALFNTKWYVNQAPEVAEFGWHPLVHYLLMGKYKSISTHPLFDIEWFGRASRDLLRYETPLHRLQKSVSMESTGPNEYFDPHFYAAAHPEAHDYPGGIINHFTEVGWKNNFDPSPHFSTAGYIAANPDVRGSNSDPLQHFVTSGRKEGRNPKPPLKQRPASLDRFGGQEYGASGPLLRYDEDFELSAEFNLKIAVHLHLYYTEMADEFIRYLSGIPVNFDLFISVPEGRGDTHDIEAIFSTRLNKCQNITIAQPLNRGRDIAPFIVEFGTKILAYDVVLHMHSKRSPHSPKHADWRRYLLHYVLGNTSIISQILTEFYKDPKVGIFQPPYHAQIQSQPKWGENRERVQSLLARLGLILNEEACPDFPAGSFFWARTSAIRPLLEGRLTLADFDEENGQIDGTTAHAVERLFGIVSGLRGYTTLCRYIDVAHNLISYFGKSRTYDGFSRDRTSEILEYQKSVSARAGKRGRVAVVTAIMGPFDALLIPEVLEADTDYFCVSDTVEDGLGVFRIVRPPYVDADPRRTARYIKTNILRLFRGYQISVWVDGNVLVREPISKFISATVKSDACIGAIPHPIRSSYLEEAEVAVEMKLDDPELIRQQIQSYSSLSELSSETLIETNFMVFDRRQKEAHNFARFWWKEINTFSRRDQLSINYCLTKSGAKWHPLLAEFMSTRDSESFCLFRHGLNEWGPKPHIYSSWYQPFMFEGGLPPLQDHYRWSKKAGTLNIDVVICVHNALEDVRACLASVNSALEDRGQIIIVDDASGAATADFLKGYVAKHPSVKLVRHETRLAYTKAANVGVKAGDSKYVLLLNSDTIVPPGALDKLVDALDRDDMLGIVGPLSNAASFQSVPSTTGVASQTAINSLPPGMTVLDMDQFLQRRWDGEVIRTPLVHGFCFCVRRSVFKDVGLFDEVNFPSGYGEENDFCFRTTDAGYDVGVTTNTYVFHAKSKSYSDSERTTLMDQGMAALVRKATKARIVRSVQTMQMQPALAAAQASVASLFDTEKVPMVSLGKRRHRLFLIPARRSDGLPAGSGYVRVLLPYSSLSLKADWEVVELHTANVTEAQTGDCIVVQRDVSSIASASLPDWLQSVRQSGARLVYEIDDDLLDAEGLVRRGFRGDTSDLAYRVLEFAKNADCVAVSSEKLLLRFSALNPNVRFVPNVIDADLWGVRNSDGRRFSFDLPSSPARPVRIGYVGTPSHGEDLLIIKKAYDFVTSKFAGEVVFQVIGGFGPSDKIFGQNLPLPVSNDYPSFVKWLKSAAVWDIGLIPLRNDNFNASKSYLKYLEYASLGAAVICSDVFEYTNVVNHDVTGLKVENTTEAWISAICSLVSDVSRRQRLARAALADIRENHTLENAMPIIRKVLGD